MAKKEYITSSPSQTKKLGEVFAKKIKKGAPKEKNARVIALIGDLGGGKTTFLQGFAKGIGIKEKILSPTFVILKKYKIPKRIPLKRDLRGRQNTRYETLYHMDCYRIQKPSEIFNLGFQEIISDSQNLIVIEWADRIKEIIPKNATWISFTWGDDSKRKIKIF